MTAEPGRGKDNDALRCKLWRRAGHAAGEMPQANREFRRRRET